MASYLAPPEPLRGKLSQVECLLDDASRRLQEEATNYEIFKTKTSASGSLGLHQSGDRNFPDDLIRTKSDINTLKSILSCPIFNRIVNVTDSLDKLSYHVNLHPSIGPSDISIDANGELILAPPIEPTSLNNIINTKLDEFSDHSPNSTGISSPNPSHNNRVPSSNHHHQQVMQFGRPSSFEDPHEDKRGFSKLQTPTSNKQLHEERECSQNLQNYVPASIVSSQHTYNIEKLVSNGTGKSGNNTKQHRNQERRSITELNDERAQRLYKSHDVLDQSGVSELNTRNNYHSTQSMDQPGEQIAPTNCNGFSNGMYRATNELNQDGSSLRVGHLQRQLEDRNLGIALADDTKSQIAPTKGKMQSSLPNSAAQYNRGSCSPSTSAGSTVRLADECDSGASSYQSNVAKGTTCSPYQYRMTEQLDDVQMNRVDSLEQELMDNFSTDMERIKVTLEKDSNGLGIIIAGYICEKEEISGIFVKSITPNSPAARSGKIRILDQIFAVNGRELLGYSNPEATNVLRHTGKVVTLELMRYLAESKYRKLQEALAKAVPTKSTNSSKFYNPDAALRQSCTDRDSSAPNLSPTKSSIPIPLRSSIQSPTKLTSPDMARPTFVQVSNSQSSCRSPDIESHHRKSANREGATEKSDNSVRGKSTTISNCLSPEQDAQSQIPVAAQRGSTTKVIETKQGARNTIEIKSPVSQPTIATYVNKVAGSEFYDSAKKSMTARLQKENPDEFGHFVRSEEPEWEKDAQIIEIYKDSSQGLGFTVKEYANPKDQTQSIIMITSLTPGGIAERDGRLSFGDLLIFVDDTNLEGASLNETVKALKKTSGQVRLGVLKLKRN